MNTYELIKADGTRTGYVMVGCHWDKFEIPNGDKFVLIYELAE